MDNQHRKISGYRDLTQSEIDLINVVKDLEATVLAFQEQVREALNAAREIPGEAHRQDSAQAFRWLSIARTDAETSFMALVRSIAQPQPKSQSGNPAGPSDEGSASHGGE